MIIFTTGRGNPVGNPIAPVLKVTANKDTFDKMKDNIDLYFGEVLDGKRSINDVGDDLLDEVVCIANGRRTKAEIYGFGFTETVMSRSCDYV